MMPSHYFRQSRLGLDYFFTTFTKLKILTNYGKGIKVVSENRLGTIMVFQPDNKLHSKIFQILYTQTHCCFYPYDFTLPFKGNKKQPQKFIPPKNSQGDK